MADVEPFRVLTRRHAVVRRVDQPTVVLGSTQDHDVLDDAAVRAGRIEVARRRGGGGAVLLRPGDHLWVDAWIPRDDPLWRADVSAAATWAGAWWCAALATLGVRGPSVHEGPARPGPLGSTVCFSGRGPGEVFHRGSKVMGLSQWRSREGALFHTCAYTRWEAGPLVDLLALDEPTRAAWADELAGSALGIEELAATGASPGSVLATLTEGLLSTFPHWGTAVPGSTS